MEIQIQTVVQLPKSMPNVIEQLVVNFSVITSLTMHTCIAVSVQDLGFLIILLIRIKCIKQIQFTNTWIKFALKTPQHSLVLPKINVSKSALIQ